MLLRNLPMPPSVNGLFRAIPGTYKRAKSKQYKTYEKEMQIWALQNGQRLTAARTFIDDLAFNKVLKLDLEFQFHRETLIAKNGDPKRLDLDNRLKAIIDCLSLMVGFDDKYVWAITARKSIIHPAIPEGVMVELLLQDLDTQLHTTGSI